MTPAERPPHWLHRLAPIADRWRTAAAAAAIAGTLLTVVVAALQVARGWEARRDTTRRELQDIAMVAAQMFGDGLHFATQQRYAPLLSPVMSGRARPGAPPLRLADFAAFGERLLAQWDSTWRDGRRGYFRVDLRRRPAVADDIALAGPVLADTAAARALRAALFKHLDGMIGAPGAPFVIVAPVAGELVTIITSKERAGDAEPHAVFGVALSRGGEFSSVATRMLEAVPYLPPTFAGVDWLTAEPSRQAPRDLEHPLRDRFRPNSAPQNRVLRVRVTDAGGAVLYETPNTPPTVWTSPYTAAWAMNDVFVIQAGVPSDVGERLVAAAVPIGSQRLLLGGVLLLAGLFAGAAAVELRRQQRLARTRADFVSAVSHELRTPLAHVSVLSETLLLGGAESPEQERKWLRAIHRESQRLGTMLENVLLFARGERNQLRLGRRDTDVADLARDVAATMQPFADARDARIEVSAPPVCEAWVDPGAVRQILLNLVDNAVKYGPAGQTVTVAVEPTSADGAPAVRLTVDDEGRGIPAAERARVWSAFTRLADDGGATGGSGLGLSVVRQLAERHGGTATIGDAPGGGARLAVVLPAVRQEPRPGARRRTSGAWRLA